MTNGSLDTANTFISEALEMERIFFYSSFFLLININWYH